MLALTNPTESPQITDHQRAQRFINDWLRRWKREHCHQQADYRVEFREMISKATIKVDWGYMGETNNHVMAQYDLARPETEALLHNTMCGLVEPFDSWKQRDSRWKGDL